MMKRCLMLLALAAACPPPAGTAPAAPERTIEVGGKPLRYLVHVPAGTAPAGGWPALLALHGAMSTGRDYLERWRPRLGERYVIICPTYTSQDSGTGIWGHWWSGEAERFVLAALDRTLAELPVDPGRVALMGMSNGGVGAYHIAIRNPRRFAGVIPMAGQLPPELWDSLPNLLAMGVCLVHGVHDQVMPVEDTDRVHGRLRDLGAGNLVYVRHEWTHPQAGGHFFPPQVLPGLIDWLERLPPRLDR